MSLKTAEGASASRHPSRRLPNHYDDEGIGGNIMHATSHVKLYVHGLWYAPPVLPATPEMSMLNVSLFWWRVNTLSENKIYLSHVWRNQYDEERPPRAANMPATAQNTKYTWVRDSCQQVFASRRRQTDDTTWREDTAMRRSHAAPRHHNIHW